MWFFDLFTQPRGRLILAALQRIERRQIMDQAQTTAALTAISAGLSDVAAQLTKSFGEVEAKLGELSAGGTTPEQDEIIASITEKLAAAKTSAQALDDLVPDAPAGGETPAGDTEGAATSDTTGG
jgi:hypothetical protein